MKPQPGDSGPCPICGEDMKSKEYEEYIMGIGMRPCSGRYWHMRHEHGIFEHYVITGNVVAS